MWPPAPSDAHNLVCPVDARPFRPDLSSSSPAVESLRAGCLPRRRGRHPGVLHARQGVIRDRTTVTSDTRLGVMTPSCRNIDWLASFCRFTVVDNPVSIARTIIFLIIIGALV